MIESERHHTLHVDSACRARRSRSAKLIATLHNAVNGREIWAITDQALVSGTNFLTNLIVARLLGLREFGVFALAWMAVLFFNTMQLSTVIAPMTSLSPKTEFKDRPGYLGAVIIHELVFVGLSTLILSLGLHLIVVLTHEPALDELRIPLSIALLAYLLQDFIRRYLFTTKQSSRAFVADAMSYLPQLPLIYFFIRVRHIHTAGVLWLVGLTSIVGVVVGAYWFEPISFDISAIKSATMRHWKMSRWLTPSSLLSWTSTNFSFLLAPVYYGAAAAGILRACYNFVAVCNIWLLGLDNVMPPDAARLLKEGGVPSLFRYLRSASLRWGSITIAFVAVLSVVPRFWLHLAYGAKYVHYGNLLRLFGVYCILSFFIVPVRAGLTALEKTSPILAAYVVMTLFSVTTAPLLASWLGLPGVIICAILTLVVSLGILLIALIKQATCEGASIGALGDASASGITLFEAGNELSNRSRVCARDSDRNSLDRQLEDHTCPTAHFSADRVACVIPYAGASKYLEETVGSAVSQHFAEIVIVNDGFPPAELAFIANVPAVRIIHLDKSVGCANARNLGIKACTTPYVVLLDHDDVLCKGYLDAIVDWLATHNLRCASAKFRYIGESSQRVGVVVSRDPNFALPSGFIAEVSLIEEVGYFPDSYGDDVLFFRAIRRAAKLTICPNAQVLYRIHPQAESSRNTKAWWAFSQLLPLHDEGNLSLTQINFMARTFANTGVCPEGLEARLSGGSYGNTRFLARSAYACWLNREYTGIGHYAIRLLAYLPELVRLARCKWGSFAKKPPTSVVSETNG
jgi:O-antigen/teichoic acid export membrane protein/glycosyltransferase involved in cell wall biosynthesis